MAEPWPEQKYGGFWIRFLAYLIDSLILGVGFVAIVMLLGMMGLELFSPELIFAVVAILYWAGMHASGRQATYGKALVGLKVTGTIGDRVSFVKALVRELAKILSTLTFLIGYILAGLTKRKQALHDFIASTQVVRAEPGHVVVAVAVGILALASPVVAGVFFGFGVVAGALEEIAATISISPDIVVQAPPKPAAPAPKPKVVQAPPAAPKPAAPVEPKTVTVAATPPVMAQPPEAPKAVAAPAAKPIPTAAPAPVVVAQATEPAKPIVVQSAEPKPVKKPRTKPAAEPKPEALPKEAAAPKPEATPAPEPAPVLVRDEPVREPMPVATGPGPRFNDLMTAVIYRDAKTVDQLIGYGKWADKPDSRGVTPLMVAAMLGDAPIAESLLKAGANPNLPGPGGDTATSIARQRTDAAMLGLLRQHGGR